MTGNQTLGPHINFEKQRTQVWLPNGRQRVVNMLLGRDAVLNKGAIGARRSADQTVKNENGNAHTNGDPKVGRSELLKARRREH